MAGIAQGNGGIAKAGNGLGGKNKNHRSCKN